MIISLSVCLFFFLAGQAVHYSYFESDWIVAGYVLFLFCIAYVIFAVI